MKIFVVSFVICLCLSACSEAGAENSDITSSSSISVSDSESSDSSSLAVEQSNTEGLLTLEEIKMIFSELDTKDNEMTYWLLKDYIKIPIDNVPVRKVKDVTVKMVGTENGFVPIHGTAVFAKVTDETLPDFPWSSIDEIKKDILKIYASISNSNGLDNMLGESFNDVYAIFYEFDDGLYFRVNGNYRIAGYSKWDHSSIKIFENKPNEIRVTMKQMDSDELFRSGRSIVKNESGNWVIGPNFYNF